MVSIQNCIQQLWPPSKTIATTENSQIAKTSTFYNKIEI
jgi:hypothetical protein